MIDTDVWRKRVADREMTVGVVGLGYVGLPLMVAFADAGFGVIGYDTDPAKVAHVNAGTVYIEHLGEEVMGKLAGSAEVEATTEVGRLAEADAVLICVPTPLTRHREPDMTYVDSTAAALGRVVRKGQLIVLESTTYPGTTREVMVPRLEAGGLKAGQDFAVAYSPEREDPGNARFKSTQIPKVVGGLTQRCLDAADALYSAVVPGTVRVSSADTAEATKLLENIFRSVNIALVNELKTVFERMGIDVWEVIDAAATKPFGYMPFYPGPGLGGHCIPIDPFYLTWRAREFEVPTRFIELAGEINTEMPSRVIGKVVEALSDHGKALKDARVLVVGLAYKADVDDIRESPSLRLIELLKRGGADVSYHDPHVPRLTPTRHYDHDMESVGLTAEAIGGFDALLIATAHAAVDYAAIGAHAKLVVDTRYAMARHGVGPGVARADVRLA
ncbi:MAG: nucleotide sugar dehydrogenase [Planctomycetota bacterium]